MRAAIPAADWISGYERSWLRADVVAGLTTAAVVIPKAMAYATIAGLPLQVGLYTAFIPMVVYAALGTSRTLSVSTTTTIAILCGAELAGMAGIFLAIPAVAVLSVLHRHLLEYRGSGGLVSELLTPTQPAPDLARGTSDSAETPSAYPAADTSVQPRPTVVTQ